MLFAVPPLVSAIVLTYRSPKDTLVCVRALLSQSIGDRLEVIVVDNHSDTDSIGILRIQLPNDPRVRIIETKQNLGYGKGNNFGAQYAVGEYLLIINPDNVLPPDALEKMVAVMERDLTIGVLAPKLVFPSGEVRDSARAFPSFADVFIKRTALKYLFPGRIAAYTQSHALSGGRGLVMHGGRGIACNAPTDASEKQPTRNAPTSREVDWAAGACLLLRRSFYEELGGFDPRFFLFFEDIDICRRTWGKGKRVVFDASITVADREHRLSEGGVVTLLTKRTVRWHLMSALKYFWKWRGIVVDRPPALL
ncbi:MAG: glycosyl transferase family protein [Candidatus Peregrinibacteria bacterium Greene0416_62]|nr:MAG: glycosyl transferase family protein [Candidatus Peregrinibacteria bacterium Greene0416_62]TSC98325.1 MAG: glycosyl transferase family protein [Candidatus Peregrinibacteria bacterium Greene1014_49]